MKKQALVIGRFQPVHNAHVQVVNELKKLNLEEIILGIGVEGKGRTEKNPFFFDEVKRMWLPISDAEIYRIPDINDRANYALHVERITGVNKENTIVVSGNSNTLVCFPKYEKLTLQPKMPLGQEYLHSSLVRKLIAENLPWQHHVPLSTIEEIDRIGIEEIRNAILNQNQDKPIYTGHVKLVKRPYRGMEWEVLVSKNACAIMYIDEQDNVYFTRQYRVPLRKEILELPAETMDKKGKSSLQVIVEGLEEECGIRINPEQVRYFTTIESSGGHDTEMVDLFYAYGPNTKTDQRLEDTEKIEVVKIPFEQAYKMVLSGEIEGSKTIALLQNEHIKRLEGKNGR